MTPPRESTPAFPRRMPEIGSSCSSSLFAPPILAGHCRPLLNTRVGRDFKVHVVSRTLEGLVIHGILSMSTEFYRDHPARYDRQQRFRLDRLFWKRAQASILQSPKIRAGVTRSPELRLAGRRRGSAEVPVAPCEPASAGIGALMCGSRVLI